MTLRGIRGFLKEYNKKICSLMRVSQQHFTQWNTQQLWVSSYKISVGNFNANGSTW